MGQNTVARAAPAVVLAVALVGGVLLLGNLAPTDVVAAGLTTVFFGIVALAVWLVVRRRRTLLVPLAATYLVVAGGAGVLLGLPLVTDDVVAEDVVRVAPAAPADPSADTASPPSTDPAAPVALASGSFAPRAHPGEGVATLVRTASGTVLTLTEFATDNGPDLFVHLVPADAAEGSVDGSVDLGRLKGNVGDQQYAVPDGVDAGAGWRVVVWCRAFSANFTEATLA